MSVVLLPIRLFTDDLIWVRLYVGCINLLLYGLLVLRADRVLGRCAGLLVAGLAGIFPIYVMFSFVFWGELIAGQIALLLLLQLPSLEDPPGKPHRWALYGAAMGAGLLAAVYVRPNLILMLPLVLAIGLAHGLAASQLAEGWRRYSLFAAPQVIIVGLGLAPWSAALTSRMGGFYLTTTSAHRNAIEAFTPPEMLSATTKGSNKRTVLEAYIRSSMSENGIVQPFASIAHGRYFVSLVPLVILTSAIAFSQQRPRRLRPRDCTNPGYKLLYGGEILAGPLRRRCLVDFRTVARGP